ncbi:exodeoxyribonuclease III [Methanococcus maripaludis]|uniref:Exonuclease III n=1 Tax=Methanococcus maripaludis (strain DSM 14266 / JCM 13030 / NBRC 101832 / S2 / LL) TaxID=267377 RepID=Q6LYH9_METMP|nr:exodeoxyribonuclease III [Methanococcus maripaludis]CAF30568.1 exonuclease III [Methanococcus maripaludis S2]
MKMLSWNVNGIRACLKNGFMNFLERESPDIMCIQETKVQSGQVQLGLDGYFQYWNYAERKGYSGTAIFTKIKPNNVILGMENSEHNNEGRVITLEFDEYYLVNVYTPNSQRGLTRLEYRQKWDEDFLSYIKTLETKKPVVFCGDLNVAHKEIDLKNPKTNVKNAGFTPEERNGFDNIVNSGFLDTFREFNNEPDNYSWWSYRFNARARNIGWRIDYFCISKSLRNNLKDAYIMPEVMGSDHCPVGIIFE